MGTNGPCTCLGAGTRITLIERTETWAKIGALRDEIAAYKDDLVRMMRDRDEYYDKYHDRREAFDELLGKIRAKLIEWQSKREQPWVDPADIIKDLCELVGEKPIEHDPDREGVYNRGAGTCQSGIGPAPAVVPSRMEKQFSFAGYGLVSDETGLRVKRETIRGTSGDHGCDPVGDGTFRMVPSGDIVSYEEMRRRLGK